MGLLEKALEQESRDQAPSLLNKAEKFREQLEASADETPEEQLPTGLLRKAEKILEEESRFHEEVFPEPPIVDDFDLWEEEAKEASQKTPIQPPSDDAAPANEDYLFDDESDFATAPIEYHLASKKKIENYQAIFEITKEIAISSNFEDFFANLSYSIIGQVGSETLAVFSSVNGDYSHLDLLEYHGFQPTSGWTFHTNDEVYIRMKASESVVYAGELLSGGLPEQEKRILEAMDAEILAPIRYADEFYGFIVLGRLVSGEEYITDDLEFVKILGDIAGSVFKRVKEFEEKSREVERIESINRANGAILSLAHEIAGLRKFEEAYDLLTQHLREKFAIEKYTFMVFDPKVKDEYVVYSSNQLTVESINNFRLGRKSDIIGMVSNVMGIYRLEDFQNNSELLSHLPNDEVGIMEDFVLIPMINLNWLVGILIVHKTAQKWTEEMNETVLSLFELTAPVFANILILDEKENSFRNPFSPIEDHLELEMKKSNDLAIPFTVVVFKVQNASRMVQILGQAYFAEYCDLLRRAIQGHLGEHDHYVRVGQGKFAAIFHSKDKEETEIVIRKIKNDFQPKESSNSVQFRPSYRILSLEYPRDTKNKEQFVEMIEEA